MKILINPSFQYQKNIPVVGAVGLRKTGDAAGHKIVVVVVVVVVADFLEVPHVR